MAAKTYIRVKDRRTGHEHDLLETQYDAKKHEKVTKKDYPPTTRPRPAKPNVLRAASGAPADDEPPASGN